MSIHVNKSDEKWTDGFCIRYLFSVDIKNTFQCYNGDTHPVSAKCDGIVDCVGSAKEDEPTSCGNHKYYIFSPNNADNIFQHAHLV